MAHRRCSGGIRIELKGDLDLLNAYKRQQSRSLDHVARWPFRRANQPRFRRCSIRTNGSWRWTRTRRSRTKSTTTRASEYCASAAPFGCFSTLSVDLTFQGCEDGAKNGVAALDGGANDPDGFGRGLSSMQHPQYPKSNRRLLIRTGRLRQRDDRASGWRIRGENVDDRRRESVAPLRVFPQKVGQRRRNLLALVVGPARRARFRGGERRAGQCKRHHR